MVMPLAHLSLGKRVIPTKLCAVKHRQLSYFCTHCPKPNGLLGVIAMFRQLRKPYLEKPIHNDRGRTRHHQPQGLIWRCRTMS
jgi:hypothetical protein